HGGADNANGAGTTPLMRATGSGDLEMVQAILEGKVKLNTAKADGTNVLMLLLGGAGGGGRGGGFGGGAGGAVTQPFAVTAARLFIDHGIDVNVPNAAGRTPLHLAANAG